MKKNNISSLFILGIVMIVFVVPLISFAQCADGTTSCLDGSAGGGGDPDGTTGGGTNISIKIDNPFKQDTIEGLIKTIVNDILLPIGGVVAVLMIIYAGFLFVTARGNEAQITKAKDALLYAVIGAAILLGAWVISQAITTTIDQLRK